MPGHFFYCALDAAAGLLIQQCLTSLANVTVRHLIGLKPKWLTVTALQLQMNILPGRSRFCSALVLLSFKHFKSHQK